MGKARQMSAEVLHKGGNIRSGSLGVCEGFELAKEREDLLGREQLKQMHQNVTIQSTTGDDKLQILGESQLWLWMVMKTGRGDGDNQIPQAGGGQVSFVEANREPWEVSNKGSV